MGEQIQLSMLLEQDLLHTWTKKTFTQTIIKTNLFAYQLLEILSLYDLLEGEFFMLSHPAFSD